MKACPQDTANLPAVTSPRAPVPHPMPAVLSSLTYAFLEMHRSGLIFTVFFMSGKLFLFVFKETNLSLFFWTQNTTLLLSWPCLAALAAAGRLCWHMEGSADLIILPPVVVLVAIWAGW